METLEAIKTRKSTRVFAKTEISDEIIETLLKAGMAAPSAVDRRPWKFYVLKSEESKKKLIDEMRFGKYECPIIIVPCVDETKTIPLMHDLAYCDLGAATENILLAATDLGLGSVWCAIYPGKAKMKSIKKALGMPLGITPYCAIYIGYPDVEKDKGKIKDKFDPKRIEIL